MRAARARASLLGSFWKESWPSLFESKTAYPVQFSLLTQRFGSNGDFFLRSTRGHLELDHVVIAAAAVLVPRGELDQEHDTETADGAVLEIGVDARVVGRGKRVVRRRAVLVNDAAAFFPRRYADPDGRIRIAAIAV